LTGGNKEKRGMMYEFLEVMLVTFIFLALILWIEGI